MAAADDAFLDKRPSKGLVLFAPSTRAKCALPVLRALIQESIYDQFIERGVARVKPSSRAARSIPTP